MASDRNRPAPLPPEAYAGVEQTKPEGPRQVSDARLNPRKYDGAPNPRDRRTPPALAELKRQKYGAGTIYAGNPYDRSNPKPQKKIGRVATMDDLQRLKEELEGKS